MIDRNGDFDVMCEQGFTDLVDDDMCPGLNPGSLVQSMLYWSAIIVGKQKNVFFHLYFVLSNVIKFAFVLPLTQR